MPGKVLMLLDRGGLKCAFYQGAFQGMLAGNNGLFIKIKKNWRTGWDYD